MRDNRSSTGYPSPKKEARGFPEFPLGLNYFISSVILWTTIVIVLYKGYDYYKMYSTMDDSELHDPSACSGKQFGKDVAENQEKIFSYPPGDSKPYLHRLGSEKQSGTFLGTPSPPELSRIPPIVTAVASNDFYAVQGLIRQVEEEIAPAYANKLLIIYDVGLNAREKELLKLYCKCEVRMFHAGVYPNHVADTGTTAYRPIIIQLTLEEFGSVIWVSPTARFKTAGALNNIMQRGDRDFMVWDTVDVVPIVAYTSPKMFEYLKEPRCLYKDMYMVDMNVLVLYRTNITWQMLMKPWLKCALTESCIAPYYARYGDCFFFREPLYTGCHRYDQSAISIILNRALQLTINRAKFIPGRIVKDKEPGESYYFPEQPWTWTQILSIIGTVCFIVGGLCFYKQRQVNERKNSYLKR